MAAGADVFAVADALKALLDRSVPRNGRRAAAAWGALAWLRGEPVTEPAGLAAVILIAASPATPARHRAALVALLEQSSTAPSRVGLDDARLGTRAESARRVAGLIAQRGPVPWRGDAVARLTALTGLTRAEKQPAAGRTAGTRLGPGCPRSTGSSGNGWPTRGCCSARSWWWSRPPSRAWLRHWSRASAWVRAAPTTTCARPS